MTIVAFFAVVDHTLVLCPAVLEPNFNLQKKKISD
jgi:hypothetical protein